MRRNASLLQRRSNKAGGEGRKSSSHVNRKHIVPRAHAHALTPQTHKHTHTQCHALASNSGYVRRKVCPPSAHTAPLPPSSHGKQSTGCTPARSRMPLSGKLLPAQPPRVPHKHVPKRRQTKPLRYGGVFEFAGLLALLSPSPVPREATNAASETNMKTEAAARPAACLDLQNGNGKSCQAAVNETREQQSRDS